MKLIALDLDGTLINQDGSISAATQGHLASLVKRDCLIAIVTGRPFSDTLYFLEMNGNMPKQGYPQYLICEERDIYQLGPDGKYVAWQKRNETLLEAERSFIPLGNELANKLAEQFEVPFFINNSFLQQERGFVELLCLSAKEAQTYTKHLEKLAQNTELQPVGNNQGISLRHRKVGKRPGLEELAKHLQLAHSEVLVMGDSFNDLAMLTAGFNAATTANAAEEIVAAVLETGGYVSPLCASDGVGEALGKIFDL